MNGRSAELARERKRLLERGELQREQLRGISVSLERDLGRVERAVHLARRLATNPLLIGAALALVVFGTRRGLLRRLPTILLAISTVRRLSRTR